MALLRDLFLLTLTHRCLGTSESLDARVDKIISEAQEKVGGEEGRMHNSITCWLGVECREDIICLNFWF